METNEQLKTLKGAKTFVKDLSEECRKNLIKAMHEREVMENLPELEDTNFKIKNTKNRKEIKDLNGVRVKVNPEGDAREYLEGYYK
jgi:hypothetical protein